MSRRLLLGVVISLLMVACAADSADDTTPSSETTLGAAQAPDVRYGSPEPVEISGYDGHAMEPFLSRDGNVLFFNSLNNGEDTSIYFAIRETDTRFRFAGEVGGVNGRPPHLDAVASMDINGNFYWTSTRDYPRVFENLQSGRFSGGVVENVNPVAGDFYIRQPGWIVMDTEITVDGSVLIFTNARFDESGPVPVESQIGAARLTQDGFLVDAGSDALMSAVNAIGIVYAPATSADGLELYFSAFENRDTAVYVATRASVQEPFGEPHLLIAGELAEAATISSDKRHLYFHRRAGGMYTIFHMERES